MFKCVDMIHFYKRRKEKVQNAFERMKLNAIAKGLILR
jgi:hypothetical protein